MDSEKSEGLRALWSPLPHFSVANTGPERGSDSLQATQQGEREMGHVYLAILTLTEVFFPAPSFSSFPFSSASGLLLGETWHDL